MPVRWTIARYALREVLVYGTLGLAAITLLFLGQSVLRYLPAFLMVGAEARHVLTIVRCVLVVVIGYTVPIALLFGVLVGIGRMAADSEVTALRACGVGLREMVVPVFVLAFAVSCFAWWISLDVEHRAKRELRDALMAMTASGRMIEPRKFNQVGDRMFYVEHRDRDDRLEGVFVSDHSDPERPTFIFARRGEFEWSPEAGRALLRLYDGDLHVEDPEGGDDYYRMSFATFDYAFQTHRVGSRALRYVRPKDMTMEELSAVIARARSGESLDGMLRKRVEEYEVQVQRRYALPVAPMVFALLALPLSLERSRGARSRGALLCALMVGAYYGILSFSQFLAEAGQLPAGIALWVPNAAFLAAAAWLLVRARRLPA